MNSILWEIERLLQVRAHEHSRQQPDRGCPACDSWETSSATDFEHKHVGFEAEQLADILVNMLEPT